MTPTDLAALREKAEKAVSEIRAAADDWARIVDLPELQAAQQRTIDIILSLLSTLAAEQQQRARLEQENEELKAKEFVTDQVNLVRAGGEPDGSYMLTLQTEIWPIIVHALAAWFVEKGGKNYVEFKAEYAKASLQGTAPPPVGPFVITMQRLLGKTPNELRLEAERERDALRAELARLSGDAR